MFHHCVDSNWIMMMVCFGSDKLCSQWSTVNSGNLLQLCSVDDRANLRWNSVGTLDSSIPRNLLECRMESHDSLKWYHSFTLCSSTTHHNKLSKTSLSIKWVKDSKSFEGLESYCKVSGFQTHPIAKKGKLKKPFNSWFMKYQYHIKTL